MKSLSKSTTVMFLFDLVILCLSTYCWASFFGYTPKAVIILCTLIVSVGLFVLFLKGHYKIREFNINLKSAYLLIEGVIMAHAVPAVYLLIYAASIKSSINFLVVNVLTIYILLRLYRMVFHYYRSTAEMQKVRHEMQIL